MSSKKVRSSSSSSSSSDDTVGTIVVFGLAGCKGDESNSGSGIEAPPEAEVGVRGKPGVMGDSDDDPSDSLNLDSAPPAILG